MGGFNDLNNLNFVRVYYFMKTILNMLTIFQFYFDAVTCMIIKSIDKIFYKTIH